MNKLFSQAQGTLFADERALRPCMTGRQSQGPRKGETKALGNQIARWQKDTLVVGHTGQVDEGRNTEAPHTGKLTPRQNPYFAYWTYDL